MSPETTVRYFEFDAAKAGPWVPAAAALLVQSSVDIDVEAVTLIGLTPDALGTVSAGTSETYSTHHAFVRLVASGAGTASVAASMPVSTGGGGGSGGGDGAVTIADGADVTQGAKAQTAATNDSGSWSIVQLIKRGLGNWTALLDRVPAIGRKTASESIPVVMPSDIATDLVADSAGVLFSPGSAPHAYTYSGGLISTESVTVGGVTRVKTYTWTSGNLTNETVWVVQ